MFPSISKQRSPLIAEFPVGLLLVIMKCSVRVESSPVAFCGDLRCDSGHALMPGMMDLAVLRVMHLMMSPTKAVMLRARARATAIHARVIARSAAMTLASTPRCSGCRYVNFENHINFSILIDPDPFTFLRREWRNWMKRFLASTFPFSLFLLKK